VVVVTDYNDGRSVHPQRQEVGAVPSVYVITEPCVGVKDKSCVEVCPVDCIHADDEDAVCYVDPDSCIGCDLCRPACPVGAIFTEDDIPAASQPWVAVNALWYRDKDAARARVAELS
jgi:ferredoxin